MREIIADVERWQDEGERVAVATLVRVHGSAPRLPGARMCLTRSGRMSGSVSAGCVESDVLDRARKVLDGQQPEIASYGIDNESAFEIGLSCGGTIDVLIEPQRADPAWTALREALAVERPAVLATGLAPATLLGRKLAILGPDARVGSIDSELDSGLQAAALDLFEQGGTRRVELPWRGENAEIFLEAFVRPSRIYIVGATHTAIPLTRMANELGFCVSVVDPRSAFATRERIPEADEFLHAWPEEVFAPNGDGSGGRLDARSYVVTLSHDPKFDIPTLRHALRSPARYIGALGSRRTHARRKETLKAMGFTTSELERIHSPIGLDLGGETPAEIAIAILAEIQAVRHGRTGVALRDCEAPIHDRT